MATSKDSQHWIKFLLAVCENTPSFKPNWTEVANKSGMYQSGQAANNAYNNLKKKYKAQSLDEEKASPNGSNTANISTAPKTPKSKRKLDKSSSGAHQESEGENPEPRKRGRKPKAASPPKDTEEGTA